MSKKNSVLISIAVLLLAGVAIGGYLYLSQKDTAPVKTDQEVVKEQEATAKENGYDSKQDNEAYRNQQQATTTTTDTNNPVITSLQQLNNGYIVLDATVGSATTGTCRATFTQGSKKLEFTSQVTRVVNYYACQEFYLPRSGFPAGGEWTVNLGLESNAGNGSATSNITIREGNF